MARFAAAENEKRCHAMTGSPHSSAGGLFVTHKSAGHRRRGPQTGAWRPLLCSLPTPSAGARALLPSPACGRGAEAEGARVRRRNQQPACAPSESAHLSVASRSPVSSRLVGQAQPACGRASGEGTGHGVTAVVMLRGGEARHDRSRPQALLRIHDGGPNVPGRRALRRTSAPGTSVVDAANREV